MNLEDIRALVRDDLAAVDRLIRARLKSDVALIDQVSSYIVKSGGKRLRPLLVLLVARAAGYGRQESRLRGHGDDGPGGDRHLTAAALIEFIHTATLLHDDVVDGSSLRRGQDTANEVWGNEASVLVGDFLYSRAFQMMSDLGSLDIMRIMADATNTIAEGEVLQLLNAHDPETTEQRYLEVIYRKTARLFEAGAEVAAVLAGAHPAQRAAFARYGRHLGTAFQLIDDVLDYRGTTDERGKNLGDDLAEGKPTLPLIRALRQGNPEQRQLIRVSVEQGGLSELQRITEAIEATGGLDYTTSLAKNEAAAALAALQEIPDSGYAAALRSLAAFAVERSH
jgi:octaprenyl-diphosphate synthase